MDWTGQKLAESLCIYLTLGFGLVAFVAGYARQDFGLMMKVRDKNSIAPSIVLMEQWNASVSCSSSAAICFCFAWNLQTTGSAMYSLSLTAI